MYGDCSHFGTCKYKIIRFTWTNVIYKWLYGKSRASRNLHINANDMLLTFNIDKMYTMV